MRTVCCLASTWWASIRSAVNLAGRRRSALLVTLNLAAAAVYLVRFGHAIGLGLGLSNPVRTWLWLALCLLVATLAVAGVRGALKANQVTFALLLNAVAGLLISPIGPICSIRSPGWRPGTAGSGPDGIRGRGESVLAAAPGLADGVRRLADRSSHHHCPASWPGGQSRGSNSVFPSAREYKTQPSSGRTYVSALMDSR